MTDAAIAKGSDEFTPRSSAFVKWFASAQNARLSPKVDLADLRSRGAGRGVVASEDIGEDEELFAVPRPLVLTAGNSTIPASVLEPLRDAGPWPPLIVSIIYEYLRKEASPWHPYFRVLPETFDSLMFWSPSELAELQASAVVRKVGRQDAEESWKETIIPLMKNRPDLFPLAAGDDDAKTARLVELAHMAGSLIMAYAFDIDSDDDPEGDESGEGAWEGEDSFEEDDENEPMKGMVPFADMLNADADKNNARLFQEDNYLVMKSIRPIQAGQEIFNDYGPLPRSDLLRMYGYVTAHYAQYDVVEFSYDLLEEVAGKKHGANMAWQKRKEALDELGLIDDGYAIARPQPGHKLEDIIPAPLHMLLRALCAKDETTKMPKNAPKDAVTIEETALLSAVLTKKLSEYSTSIEEDEAILTRLASESESQVARPRYRMAVEVRKGEKEVLQQAIHLCQDHIAHQTTELAKTASKRRKHEDRPTGSKKVARTEKGRH